MKKFISSILISGIICQSLAGTAVFANNEQSGDKADFVNAEARLSDDALYTDYVPGEMPANLMNIDITPSRTFVNNAGRNSTTVDQNVGKTWSDAASCFTPVDLVALADITAAGDFGFYGITFKRLAFDNSKTYVMSFLVKKTAGDKVNLGVALTNERAGGAVYSNEYGTTGKEIGDTSEEFTCTIKPAAGMDYSSNHVIVIGFPEGVKKDSEIEIDTSAANGVYFAEEKAYNITNTLITDASSIKAGAEVKLKAEVVNQKGTTGMLAQNITWHAMNKEKTAEVNGFEFSTNSDGTESVKIADTVKAGEYSLVAVSDDYSGFVRTAGITIPSAPIDNPDVLPDNVNDYVPGEKNTNLMDIDITSTRTFVNGTTRNTTLVDDAVGKTWNNAGQCFSPLTLYSVSDITEAGNIGFWGLMFKSIAFAADTSYVYSFRAKKIAGDTVKLGTALTNEQTGGVYYSKEYGQDGAEVTSEFQTFKYTLKAAAEADYTKTHSIVTGFPAGTAADVKVEFDTSEADGYYFGVEQAYDISNTLTTDKDLVCQDSDIQVKAQVLNQIGTTGNLRQNFTWYAADKEKTKAVKGFKFTINPDGTTTVNIDSSVATGEYSLIAVSNDYDGFVKTLNITVNPKKVNDEDFDSSSLYKMTLDTVDGNTTLNVGDKITLKAAVVLKSTGKTDSHSQAFNWYILNSMRNEIVSGISTDVNTDKNEAIISIDEFTEAGKYYIVAEQVNDDTTVRKSVGITVDTPELWEYAATYMKTATATQFASVFAKYASSFGIDFVTQGSYDAETASAILLNSKSGDITSKEEMIRQFKRAIAVSLYCKNPNNIELYTSSGDFKFADEMALSDIDTDGTTIKNIFDSYISATGKTSLQKDLAGGAYTSFADFAKAFAQNTILRAIEYPSVSGTGYIENVLTKNNADLAGITIDKYLSSSYKTQYNKMLLKNKYTVSSLEEAIRNFTPTTNSGGGSGGGSSGGGKSSTSPAVNTVNVAAAASADTNKTDEDKMFSDVDETHWAYADIYQLKQMGIAAGNSDNTFDPEGEVTREQFTKMICAAFGYSVSEGTSDYSDVDSNAWYAPYIKAAADKKIINGTGNNIFGIGMPIKRQDLSVMVYRALGTEEAGSGYSEFSDDNDISDYARSAVLYLNSYGIISGFDDNTFRPKENCTRAQAAKILCKILNAKKENKE